MIQFDVDFEYVNISVAEMDADEAAQQAALIATADAFGNGVSTLQLEFKGATAVTRRRWLRAGRHTRLDNRFLIETPSCNILIELTAPVEQMGTENENDAYAVLVNSLDIAFYSGAYQADLQQAFVATGANITTVVDVTSVTALPYIVFNSTSSPTVSPTVPAPVAQTELAQSLLGFFALFSFSLFACGVFLYWTQVTFHAAVLSAKRKHWPELLLEMSISAYSLYNFMYYMVVFGGTSLPFALLILSRLVMMAATTRVLHLLLRVPQDVPGTAAIVVTPSPISSPP